MEHKAKVFQTIRLIHGGHVLQPEDISFVDASETNGDLLEFRMNTNFDVDAVFGTNTAENNDTLNVCAYFDPYENRVCDSLSVIVGCDDESEYYGYRLTRDEWTAFSEAMRKFAHKHTGEAWANKFFVAEGASREKEFQYLAQFARDAYYSSENDVNLLRTLWTAYCFHHDLEVDTSPYDNEMLRLWEIVEKRAKVTSSWKDFDGFDMYMAKYML